MTSFYFLRHAPTAWNGEKRMQGRTDVPLTEASIAALSELSVDSFYRQLPVFASPATRALQTAQALGLSTPTEQSALLEMDWGDWEGQTVAELRQQLGDEMARNEDRGLDFRPTSGESPREVQSRVLKWMRTLGAANSVSMIVTHKGVIRSVLAAAFDWPMLGRAPVKLDWGRCHHFVLESDGRIRLAQPNLTLTLPPPPQPLV